MKCKTTFLFLLILFTSSCRTMNFFENTPEAYLGDITELVKVSDTYEHKLKASDKINLSVSGHEDLSIGSIFNVYNSNHVYGKWVLIDVDGYATIPEIGKVKLAGLTLREAELKIAKLYESYIVDPIVVVQAHNWEITVIGEVIKPGVFQMEKMNNTMLEYISKAGGFDSYADITNIKLMRQEQDTLRQYNFDLTDLKEYSNSQANLYPGDVIIISSTSGKKLDRRIATLIPYASFFSALAILFTIF